MSEVERRRSPRSQVAISCRLTRRIGSPIDATTVDLGAGGMSVATPRPLAVDEELVFELPPQPPPRVTGRAVVMRDRGCRVYSLRFERLPEHMLADLDDLASG